MTEQLDVLIVPSGIETDIMVAFNKCFLVLIVPSGIETDLLGH